MLAPRLNRSISRSKVLEEVFMSPPLLILYAEDDPDTRELVTFILAQQGCEVIATDAQDQALALARNRRFDLYVIDTWLRGKSGTDLCRQFREFDKETPILFYTGAAFPNDKERALACGAQGYLVKPSHPEELIAEVFRLVSDARRRPSISLSQANGG
jgi:DNA-binding response OmpR family regulator